MEENKKSGLCTAALIMGILCMIASILPFGNFLFGLLGLIFAIICLAKKKGTKTKAVWALVLSIVGWVLRILLGIIAAIIIFVVIGFGAFLTGLSATLANMGLEDVASSIDDYNNSYNNGYDDDYDDWDSDYGDWSYGNDDDWGDDYDYDDYDYDDWDYDDWDYGTGTTSGLTDWIAEYRPGETVVQYDNFEFTVPEGFYVVGSLAEEGEDAQYYYIMNDSCGFYFPEYIYYYDSDNYEDAYDEILDYWFGYSMYPEWVTWEEGDITYWNEDWYATRIECMSPMDDGSDVYSYCVIAFSTHENAAVVFTAYPENNEYSDDCNQVQYLLDYVDYIG